MKIKQNKGRLFYLWLLNLFILFSSLIVFGGKGNFSVDSYGILFSFVRGDKGLTTVSHLLSDFAFSGAFVNSILNRIGITLIPDSTIAIILYAIFVSVFISVTSYIVISHLYEQTKTNVLLIDFSLLIVVINVALGSLLSFPECIINICLAIVFCLSAFIIMVYFSGFIGSVISVLLLIIAAGFSNAFYPCFAVLSIILCIMTIVNSQEQKVSQLLKVFIRPAMIFIISGVLYAFIAISLTKIFNVGLSGRANFHSVSDIIHNIAFIISKQKKFLCWPNQFNTIVMGILAVSSFIVWFIAWATYVKRESTKGWIIAAATFCAYVCMFTTGILSGQDSTRGMMSVFSMYPLLWIGTMVMATNYKKVFTGIGLTIISLVLLLNIAKINECETNQKKTNAADKLWAQSVIYYIERYEQETGNHIQYIAFADDAEPIKQYYEKTYSDSPAMHCKWARTSLINLNIENHEYLEEDDMPELHASYFGENNWDTFVADEQLIFEDNIVYVCVY